MKFNKIVVEAYQFGAYRKIRLWRPDFQRVNKKKPPCAYPRNFKQRWLVTAKLFLSGRLIIIYQNFKIMSIIQ